MIAKWFRFIDDDSKPTGWVGLAIAHDKKGLFWQIDEHGNPYSVEVMPLRRGGSVCMEYKYFLNEDGETDADTIGHEVCEETPIFEDEGWKKPNWPEDVLYVRGEGR